ncbi:MAG: DUF1385 domain-containing protein [Chloroflexi bacterium]|nr:DUF1385 domain-containing protein [Chloroflexota bacterium]
MGKPTYGGQAVIEGVMMRGQKEMAVAVRDPSGNIVVHSEVLTGAIYTSKWAKLPLIRGCVMMWDTLILGTRTLLFSARVAAAEEDAEEAAEVTPTHLWLTMGFALAMAVGLFFLLPVALVGFTDRFISNPLASNLIEKVIRLTLIVGYIGGVGFVPDVRRVFAYHGAEHKAVNALEDGAPLEVDVVDKYSTAHPRCGTSFLLIVVIVSFVVFSLLGRPSMEVRLISRIVLIPVIAGIAYEFIRFGGAHHRNPIVKALLTPGLALQRLTTREPSPDQVEVAIVALKRVLAGESAPDAAATKPGELLPEAAEL